MKDLNKSQVIESLIAIFKDQHNFLIKLSVHLEFDKEQYERTRDLFVRYIDLIEDDRTVDRRIGRFMLDILAVIEGGLFQFRQRNHNQTQVVGRAHAEMLDIAYKLFT